MSQPAESNFRGILEAGFHEHDSDATKKQKEAENVRRVEQLLSTFMSGNYEALHGLLADDVEMEIVGPDGAVMVGRQHGMPAVIDAIRNNFSMLEDQHPTIDSVIAQGDQVVLVGREKGRVRLTGRSYDMGWVQIYTFREGKIRSMREIFDTASWMAAAKG